MNVTRTKKIVCKGCKTEYEIPLSANFMYFCPNCKEYNGCECEYGFAAIVPCEIYVGEKLIGRITGGFGNYRLECNELGISTQLTGKYKDLEVYHEARDIIRAMIACEKSGCNILDDFADVGNIVSAGQHQSPGGN